MTVMSSREPAKIENLQADIVVIGGGGSGLAAAVAAAEKEASVIVLEKRGLGGNSAKAFGIFAAESPVQKQGMIDCRKEDCFKLAMDFAHWRINPKIVRAFIEKSGDTIQWLEEKGTEFDCTPFYPNQIATWHIPKGRGAALIKILAQKCRELGVNLRIRTPVRKIIRGEKGSIVGVLAEAKDREIQITTKSVIIATGGYGGNKNLLKKYCPDYRDNMKCEGVRHTGDGLLMATEMGAATEGLGILLMSGPIPQESGPMTQMKVGVPPKRKRLTLMFLALDPRTIWVNKRGERFADETVGYYHFESSNAVARQPERLSYTTFDSKVVAAMTKQGLILGMGVDVGAQGNELTGLERELKACVDKGVVGVFNTRDEMADWIGADPKVLKTTIDEYNAACDQGYDPIFAKDRKYLLPLRTPPYYAIKCSVNFLNTIGGIKINEHMEVLDRQDNPIPGLYAVGVDTGGWETETYCERLSGSTFGFAVNSGRIAGENAADFISLRS